MRIITSGSGYVDIDVYAGTVAYSELLNIQGTSAKAATSAPMNSSVPHIIRDLGAPIDLNYTPTDQDSFTIVDLSDPTRFDKMVDHNRVDEIIDHHVGFEAVWDDRPEVKVQIEYVGAACTLIFERWQDSGLLNQMSKTCAKLLVCGILDNTLNLQAEVTDDRDRKAFNKLMSIGNLPDDWPQKYFRACEESMLSDMQAAVRNDAKILTLKGWEGKIGAGQIAIWDAKDILPSQIKAFDAVLPSVASPWIANIASISAGKSYFLCKDDSLKDWFSKLLNVSFDGDIAIADRLWLRKEIVKRSLEIEKS